MQIHIDVMNFTFVFDSALCNWKRMFHRELHSVTVPAAFRHIFVPKVKPQPQPWHWPFEPCRLSRNTIVSSFKSFPVRGFRFIMIITHPPAYIHTHYTHRDKVKVPPYHVVGADNNCPNAPKSPFISEMVRDRPMDTVVDHEWWRAICLR